MLFVIECLDFSWFVCSTRSDDLGAAPADGGDPLPDGEAPEVAPGDVTAEDVEAAVAEAEDNMLEWELFDNGEAISHDWLANYGMTIQLDWE